MDTNKPEQRAKEDLLEVFCAQAFPLLGQFLQLSSQLSNLNMTIEMVKFEHKTQKKEGKGSKCLRRSTAREETAFLRHSGL
jgi:hypothetical protein